MGNNILDIEHKVLNDNSIFEYEYDEFQPNTGTKLNDPGEIDIQLQSERKYYHPSESYLIFEGQLQKKADGSAYANADLITLINNAPLYCFDSLRYYLDSNLVEAINHPGQATTMLGMLKYSNDFNKSTGISQCWKLDTSTDAAVSNDGFSIRRNFILKSSDPKGSFSFLIPLSHIFGFCEDYTKVLYGFKHMLTMVRKKDNDAIFRGDEAAEGKILITKIAWYIPYVNPSDQEKARLYKIIEAKKSLPIDFRKINCDRYNVRPTRNDTWNLGTLTNGDPQLIVLGFQTGKNGDQQQNPALFDHCNTSNIQVRINSSYHPKNRFRADFKKNQFARFYKLAADFRKDFFGVDNLISNWGISPIDFKDLFPLFVFDVSRRNEALKGGSIDLKIDWEFSENPPANTTAYVVIISDQELLCTSDGEHFAIKN